ncbi:uncharacterized protein LOC126674262 [Mercurialis annua]|uniref:uncharacterized protein LOC126674262 n=1 Tax=Mercurialis annua TaxID=3986 RepID=UPI00215F0B95|nr:uncharacterized protein LOC126674262 [Mercurialis annua]
MALHQGFQSYTSINPVLGKKDWQLLWGLKIPHKQKIFIWRCIHDGIPSGQALHNRLQIDDSCAFYGMKEDLMHLLFHCSRAKQIWFASPLTLRFTWDPTSTFAMIWKQIWKSRNKKIFESQDIPTSVTINAANQDCQEFHDTILKTDSRLISPFTRSPTYPSGSNSTIPEGFIKLSYDAAVNSQKRFGCIAVVAISSHQSRLHKFSAVFRYIWDPGILECLALREAMNWGICEDIWHLKRSFTSTIFRYIPRQENTLAHQWAQIIKAAQHFL